MHTFAPGDDLIFQLESAFGLLRVLAIDGEGGETVWHLLAYDEFFPDVESAERALAQGVRLPIRQPDARVARTLQGDAHSSGHRLLACRHIIADDLV